LWATEKDHGTRGGKFKIGGTRHSCDYCSYHKGGEGEVKKRKID